MIFAQRLKEIMEQYPVTMYRLSKDIGVHQTTIRNWLDGNSEPKAEMLCKLATYFGISADYLLGIDTGEDLGMPIIDPAAPLDEEDVGEDLGEPIKPENIRLEPGPGGTFIIISTPLGEQRFFTTPAIAGISLKLSELPANDVQDVAQYTDFKLQKAQKAAVESGSKSIAPKSPEKEVQPAEDAQGPQNNHNEDKDQE